MGDSDLSAVDHDELLSRALRRGEELRAASSCTRRSGLRSRARLRLGVAMLAASVFLVALAASWNRRDGHGPVVSRHFAPLALTSHSAPSPRTSVALGYYPPRNEVVLFGGDTPDERGVRPHGLGDTWLFDDHGWRRVHPQHSPPAREGGLMVYDPTTRLLMLFGGYSARLPTTVLSDTWAWNGSDWRQLHPKRVPTWMPGASIAVDPTTGDVTELAPEPGYAGSSAPIASFNADRQPVGRWLWTGENWLYRPESTAPPLVWAAGALVADPLSRGLLFFTYDFPSVSCLRRCKIPPDPTGTRYSETWLWNGTRFIRAHPSRAPTSSSLVVADFRLSRVVDVDALGRVWAWDGSSWTRLVSDAGPVQGTAAVYDSQLGDVVVYGTMSDSDEPTSQTWLWNGTDWFVAP